MKNDAELDLTALRYIAGELDDVEHHAFETCLEEDQAAREAVARAVLIAEAAATPAPVHRRSVLARLWPVAAAAALVLFVSITLQKQTDVSTPPATAELEADALIRGWLAVDLNETAENISWGVESEDSAAHDWLIEALDPRS